MFRRGLEYVLLGEEYFGEGVSVSMTLVTRCCVSLSQNSNKGCLCANSWEVKCKRRKGTQRISMRSCNAVLNYSNNYSQSSPTSPQPSPSPSVAPRSATSVAAADRRKETVGLTGLVASLLTGDVALAGCFVGEGAEAGADGVAALVVVGERESSVRGGR